MLPRFNFANMSLGICFDGNLEDPFSVIALEVKFFFFFFFRTRAQGCVQVPFACDLRR